jgi:hypothetical protein
MVRSIIAVICGLIIGSVFNYAIVFLSWKIFPLPAAAESDPEKFKSYILALPATAFLLILVAHIGGTLIGGYVAAFIARRAPLILGAIVGVFFLIAGIMNVVTLPAPIWFDVVDLVLFVPAGIYGARLAPRRAAAPTA